MLFSFSYHSVFSFLFLLKSAEELHVIALKKKVWCTAPSTHPHAPRFKLHRWKTMKA